MVFDSLGFFLFFGAVFFLYYYPLKEKTRAQNWLLLLSSYFFYGFADWKMIPLLLVATIIFYILGLSIHKSTKKYASLLTTLGILVGAGLLIYFKYFNFFIESFSELFEIIGLKSNWGSFNIILPLGISFFTFRLISYIIEIHRGKIEASDDFVIFATYIAFFPTIMSGPIDRPNGFIPQLRAKRTFDYNLVVDGSRQILWGLFQKIVIADNLASIVNEVWVDIPSQSGSTLVFTAILYSIQIYTDFSGYSHMAIGIGKILGFRITKNFNYPYFSKNIAEFWRNWHISLTSWLTDYIFMPLNIKFRNLGKLGIILAIIINMIVVGLWHGANWTFVVFGLFHGLLFIPLIVNGSIFKKKKIKVNMLDLPLLGDFLKIISTFFLVTLSLIIFRAISIHEAMSYLAHIFSISIFSIPEIRPTKLMLLIILFFIFAEWLQRNKEHALQIVAIPRIARYAICYVLIFYIFWLGGNHQDYIYFQF